MISIDLQFITGLFSISRPNQTLRLHRLREQLGLCMSPSRKSKLYGNIIYKFDLKNYPNAIVGLHEKRLRVNH